MGQLTSDRLRLLVLAPFAPRLDATHGGGRVLASFLAHRVARYRVALLYLRAPDDQPVDPFFVEHCELIREVVRPWAGASTEQKITRLARLLAALLHGLPMWVADWKSPAFAKLVQETSTSWQPDLVQLDFSVMLQYLPALDGCPAPRVFADGEVGTLSAPYLKGRPAWIGRFAHRLDVLAWARFYRRAICQVQAMIGFTPKDCHELEQFGGSTPIYQIPFGTDLPAQPLNPLGATPPNLLFMGNFQHNPNITAALRLVRDIFPPLARRYPQLTLSIVGPNPPAELKQLAGERVVITGWVPDPKPYVDGATVFVAPLDSGGGMRVKILETLSAGKAVVATPLAVEGLQVQNGAECLIAEDNLAIIDAVAQLLDDPDLRLRLATQARAWACENLGWEKTIAAYDRLYAGLLTQRGGR